MKREDTTKRRVHRAGKATGQTPAPIKVMGLCDEVNAAFRDYARRNKMTSSYNGRRMRWCADEVTV